MKPRYLTPSWPAPSSIKAFTTLRCDGYSKPPFDSFNLSTRELADRENALANRQLLCTELQLMQEPVWINQVHGVTAIQADVYQHATSEPDADASYTRVPTIPCAVLTADCLPLLVCNRTGTEVAAIHAGWKGLQAGVIQSTFQQLKSSPQDCLVWLGPAIGPNAFEVGNEVRDLFLQADPQAEAAFTQAPEQPRQKWLGNLYTLARQRLAYIGVKPTRIYGGEYCTYTETEKFYSFRRNPITGRMASLIWIVTT